MTDSDPPPAKRLKLNRKDLEDLSKEDLIERWMEQEQYVDNLETRNSDGQKDSLELLTLRESEDKLRQQQLEATRRENLLVMRLAAKEQEMQECANQIQELKQSQTPGSSQLRSTLLDPAVNLMFERMKKEMHATKAKLEETQNELSAWKFTPDSNTGKRLMAKCRLLYQENEELGKMISSGRMAKLEGDLALQKNFSEEMKKSQAELDEFLLELDEDVEGMQSTILYLQQQLREAKDQVLRLQSENQQMLANKSVGVPGNNNSEIRCSSPKSNSFVQVTDSSRVSVVVSTPTDNHIESNGEHIFVALADGAEEQVSCHIESTEGLCSSNPPTLVIVANNGECATPAYLEAEARDTPLEVHVDDTSQDFLGQSDTIGSPDQLDSYTVNNKSNRTVTQTEDSESGQGLEHSRSPLVDKEQTEVTTKWVQEEKTELTTDCQESLELVLSNGTGDGNSSISDDET